MIDSTSHAEAIAWLAANVPDWIIASAASEEVPDRVAVVLIERSAIDVPPGGHGRFRNGEGATILEAVQAAVRGL